MMLRQAETLWPRFFYHYLELPNKFHLVLPAKLLIQYQHIVLVSLIFSSCMAHIVLLVLSILDFWGQVQYNDRTRPWLLLEIPVLVEASCIRLWSALMQGAFFMPRRSGGWWWCG